jgi:ribosomal protein S18 acetylase RimI-like enzyme
MATMETGAGSSGLTPRFTSDPREYLDGAGSFLRRRPVEHSVLLSVVASHLADTVARARPDLWLWVEDHAEVVAAAQNTPPHGAYLSTGPTEAMQALARTLWRLRPDLPGVAGLGSAPREFATEWSRLGGPQAAVATRLGLYAADDVTLPLGIAGRLRLATDADASLLRDWSQQFVAEAGVTPSTQDRVGPLIHAGLLSVWEVDGAMVSMAAVTVAEGGVCRVQLVYTPPENRRRGYASACVAALTARELTTAGLTCVLYTDLANATSNDIYQAIGYRRVGDAVDLRFDIR